MAVEWLIRALTYLVVVFSSLAAMTLIAAAAPSLVDRERRAARSGMRRCFTWGVVFTINCVLLAALLALVDGALGNVAALAILVGLLVVSLAGLGAVATEVGHRVLLLAERPKPNRLASLAVGTLVLFSVAVIPVFGWLVFTGGLLTGIGAFLEVAAQDYRPLKRGQEAPGAAQATREEWAHEPR